MMDNINIIGALVGLIGAVNNNGKTNDTDDVICKALLLDDYNEAVREVHREKFKISPNCATCKSPCGNTSDYDMENFFKAPDDTVELKVEIINQMRNVIQRRKEGENLPDIIYRAIYYMGYDMQKESYIEVLEELKKM